VLKEELQLVIRHLFNILSLLYDADSMRRIEQNLEKNTKESVALAMEMIDILLDENLKALISPLIDQIPIAEKLAKLQNLFPQQRFKKSINRLKNIIYYDFSKLNRWVKACAIHQLIKNSNENHAEIEALVFHEDFFLKETALVALHHAKPSLYHFYTSRERKRDKIKYDRVTGYNRKLERVPSNYQEVSLMKRNVFLDKLPETLLVKLSELAEQESIQAGKSPDFKYLKGNRVHFVVEGEFELIYPDKSVVHYQLGDAIGLIEDVNMEQCQFRILTNTKLFYMDKPAFYIIAQAHIELVKIIYQSLTKTEEPSTMAEESFEQMSHVVSV